VKAAVVGAGPAGLAAATFLAREGFEAHVFEREGEPGGIVRWLLPGFRLPAAAVEKDVSLLADLGVHFHYGVKGMPAYAQLNAEGFRYMLAGIGAERDTSIGIEGAREAFAFLRQFRKDPSSLRLGRSVVVVGAGDTAMDTARAARRCRGVKDVRIVYRRSEREMPASAEEYASAREEGIWFHFLRAPESWTPEAGLVCRVMELGAADQTGRSRPVATEARETFPADSLITALGAEVDNKALESLGLPPDQLAINPRTQETAVPGLFLIGDAAAGAETIVRAIASARRAVDAICARESAQGTEEGAYARAFEGAPAHRAPAWDVPAEDTARLRVLRDRLIPVSAAAAGDDEARDTESRRCLGCRALCLKCVEVCPNRANTFVRVPGLRDEAQIVHLESSCNECGNCATFCPWEGRPYKDKVTVFESEEDFRDSTNPGFFLENGRGMVRMEGRVRDLVVDDEGNVTHGLEEASARAVVRAIVRDYPYLLGGTR
jgi:putative selenate reductase